MARALPPGLTTRLTKWNAGGVSGVLLALIASSWWMVPRALDSALASPAMEVAKFVTLPAPRRRAARAELECARRDRARLRDRERAAMWAVVGWAYMAAPVRVCNYYLVDQQVIAGLGLLSLAVALGVAVALMSFRHGAHAPTV
jgi:hypothetical protein